VSSRRLERILLVGFMGSGKTSVGRSVADRLGWRFIDFDTEVEAEAGAPIPRIFEEHGEPYFRALEERIADRLLGETGVVLGSGGGWAAAPGRLTDVPAGTETFWLAVSPEQAVARASARPGSRPLLAGPDPLERASKLLAERAPVYRSARWTVDTEDASVEDVSSRIQEILTREYPDLRWK